MGYLHNLLQMIPSWMDFEKAHVGGLSYRSWVGRELNFHHVERGEDLAPGYQATSP